MTRFAVFLLHIRDAKTMLNILQEAKYDVISIGKIVDIFVNEGITEYYKIVSNNVIILLPFMYQTHSSNLVVDYISFWYNPIMSQISSSIGLKLSKLISS